MCPKHYRGGGRSTIVVPTQLHFSKVISLHMSEQVMWKVPAWRLTFQLPQQTNHLIVTEEFTPL